MLLLPVRTTSRALADPRLLLKANAAAADQKTTSRALADPRSPLKADAAAAKATAGRDHKKRATASVANASPRSGATTAEPCSRS